MVVGIAIRSQNLAQKIKQKITIKIKITKKNILDKVLKEQTATTDKWENLSSFQTLKQKM